jgi:hypothetical protein
MSNTPDSLIFFGSLPNGTPAGLLHYLEIPHRTEVSNVLDSDSLFELKLQLPKVRYRHPLTSPNTNHPVPSGFES